MARNSIQVLSTVQYFRGDTNKCQFTRTLNAVPVDITGFSYLLTVSRLLSPKAAEAAANEIMQVVGVLDDAVNGVFSFAPSVADYSTILDADYEQLSNGVLVASFYYDIQETNAAAEITTIGTGTFQVIQDITK